VLLLGIIFDQLRHPNSGLIGLFLFSPGSIMAFNETNDWGPLVNFPWVAVVVNFAAYGWILGLLRRMCYTRADRLLGRMDAEDASEIQRENSEVPESSQIERCLSEK
jgi:hypothetical protein